MAADRPTILFVFADQHRYSVLGCSGNAVVRTPNLDRMAGEGVVFDHAFACYPLCSPYRGQLLTGAYCHRNLVVDNEYALRGPWLFDRQADPLEMKSLAGDPEHAAAQQQLEARLEQWIRETGDPFETGPRDRRIGMLALGQRFTHGRWDKYKP